MIYDVYDCMLYSLSHHAECDYEYACGSGVKPVKFLAGSLSSKMQDPVRKISRPSTQQLF